MDLMKFAEICPDLMEFIQKKKIYMLTVIIHRLLQEEQDNGNFFGSDTIKINHICPPEFFLDFQYWLAHYSLKIYATLFL